MPHIRRTTAKRVRHQVARIVRARRWSMGLRDLRVDLTDADLRADLEYGRD